MEIPDYIDCDNRILTYYQIYVIFKQEFICKNP